MQYLGSIMLIGMVHLYVEKSTIFNNTTYGIHTFYIQIVKDTGWIDETKTLAIAIAQTSFGQLIFQSRSYAIDAVLSFIQIQSPDALYITLNISNAKGILGQTSLMQQTQPCYQ